jgi:hypothetical protein
VIDWWRIRLKETDPPTSPTWCAPNYFSLLAIPYSLSLRSKTHRAHTESDSPPPSPREMERIRPQRRVQIDQSQQPKYDAVEEDENGMRLRQSNSNVTDDQEPFMGVKARRKASFHRDYKGDYIDVASHPFLIKLLQKQGLLSMHSNICNACFALFFLFFFFFFSCFISYSNGLRPEITRFYATFECEFDRGIV